MRWVRAAVVPLAALMAAVLVWMAGVGAVRQAVTPSDADRQRQIVATARLAAQSLASWQAAASSQATALSHQLEPWTGFGDQLVQGRRLLDEIVPAADTFDASSFIVDRDGRVVVTASSQAVLFGQLRRNPAVDAALRGQAAISGLVDDPLERVITVDAAAPLRDAAGHVSGAVVGRTHIPDGTLWQRILAIQRTVGTRAVVVTADGVVLDGSLTPTPGSVTVGNDLSTPVQKAKAGVAGLVTYAGEAGTRSAAAYAPAANGWVIVIPQPLSRLSAGSRAAGRLSAAWLGGALAAAVTVIVSLNWWRRRTFRQVEEAKRGLLAIAGHELRTPLTLIKGFTQTLTARWDRMPDAARRDIVGTIDRQARNLEHLVDRLLVGAELEAGITSRSLSLRPVDVAAVLEAAAVHHRAQAPLHTIAVQVEPGLKVRADIRALEQVVTNLVENAIKYSPEGGTIDLRARRGRRSATIVVEDEGIGLPSDTVAIFEKFVQRENVDTRTHDEGGVGLGLYIVRNLTTTMGGTVRAERRAPQGARFVVTLPVWDPRRSSG